MGLGGMVALGVRLREQTRVAGDVVWIASVAHKKRPHLGGAAVTSRGWIRR